MSKSKRKVKPTRKQKIEKGESKQTSNYGRKMADRRKGRISPNSPFSGGKS